MKEDDHNFGGNLNGGGDAEADSPLGRELEARVVAAVAGEASAFEAAEVERIAAENPAVAEFKRRIEAVQGFVTEAARPDAQPLRLSAERRAKVLAAIGAAAPAKGNVVPLVNERKKAWRRQGWLVATAACAGFAALLFVVSQPAYQKVRVASELPAAAAIMEKVAKDREAEVKAALEYKSVEAAPLPLMMNAPAPQAPVALNFPMGSVTGSVGQVTPLGTQNARASSFDGRLVQASDRAVLVWGTDNSKIGAGETFNFANASSTGATASNGGGAASVNSAPAPAATPQPASDIVKMDAFVVSAERDGFAAAATLAASSAPTKVVPPSLTDVVQTNADIMARDLNRSTEEQAKTETHAGVVNLVGVNGTIAVDDPTRDFQTTGGALFNANANLDLRSVTMPPGSSAGTFSANSAAGDIIDTGLGGVRGRTAPSADAEARMDLSKELADLRKLNEAPAAGQRGQETGALNQGVITLSPFQVSSDKDTGYKAISRDSTNGSPAAADGAVINGTLLSSGKVFVLANGNIQVGAGANITSTGGAVLSALQEPSDFPVTTGGKLSLSEYSNSVALGNVMVGGDLTSRFGSIVSDADKKQVARVDALALNPGSARGFTAFTTGGLVGGEKEKADAPLARAKAPADESLRLETSTATQSVSTFSLHVSDVSFRLAQAALARGEAPDPAAIRPEEFYNAFNYGDPAPAVAEKVGCWQEQSAHPFLAQRNLLRIALKVAATGRAGSTPLRLTVLLDTSGSMEREDRAATVRQAMEVLVSLLGPNDRLTLIGFARQPRLLAENLLGDRAREVLDIIARTPAEGGTNMEEALKLATQLALRHREAKAQNRIVMLTDGAANLGNAVPEQLATRIEELRQRGIAFDACGVGLDGLDDGILEALTRKGDGRYYVLNSPDDAGGGFAQKLAGAFRPAAENVKVQVRFNPARVATYRLIGFEQHRLKEQDFRNDKIDAAELAAEEAGVALYQFEPLPQGEGDVGEVFVRFRDPATDAMVERSWTIPYEARVAAFDRAAPSLQLAGVAALLAEKLRNDAGAAQITLRDFATVMSTLQARYRNEPRVQELATMFAQARRLTGQ